MCDVATGYATDGGIGDYAKKMQADAALSGTTHNNTFRRVLSKVSKKRRVPLRLRRNRKSIRASCEPASRGWLSCQKCSKRRSKSIYHSLHRPLCAAAVSPLHCSSLLVATYTVSEHIWREGDSLSCSRIMINALVSL